MSILPSSGEQEAGGGVSVPTFAGGEVCAKRTAMQGWSPCGFQLTVFPHT